MLKKFFHSALTSIIVPLTTPLYFLSPKLAISIWRKTGVAKGTIYEE